MHLGLLLGGISDPPWSISAPTCFREAASSTSLPVRIRGGSWTASLRTRRALGLLVIWSYCANLSCTGLNSTDGASTVDGASPNDPMRDAATSGQGSGLDTGVDAEVDAGSMRPEPLRAPTTAGLATVGARRSDGALTVYDDGLELGERRCTANGQHCVTGAIVP